MNLLDLARQRAAKWPYWLITVLGGMAAFGCYTSMYAFRKAFASATFENQELFHIDYKVWLVIAQMVGYTLSKFYGIRFISESGKSSRARSIIFLIVFSWIALLGFALVPAPYNIAFLFLNGFPLGMIWGLVFSYLEGRRTTEFMGALMSISLIFASGFVKTVARTLMLLVGAKASSLNKTLNPPCCFTPPWQAIHFLLRMGFTSVLKSICFSAENREKATKPAAIIKTATTSFFFCDSI